MSTIKELAEQYFRAFHEGDLEKVYSFLSEQAVVQYGNEAPQKGKDFFPQAKDMISQLKFSTLGVYTSETTRNVIIHFSFDAPNEAGTTDTTEAIDLIEFGEDNKILKISVIPRA